MNKHGILTPLCVVLLCWSIQVNSAETSEQEPESEKNVFWKSWKKVVDVLKITLEKDTAENRDPWESWNRRVFAFNDAADRWFLSPVARGYQWVAPDPIEKGIGNVFSNLFELNVIVNDLLQFKLAQAASDSGRFLVNTTVGIGGLFDVASSMGLEKHHEDFGQTFGKWGISSGPYIVVPLFGSYTIRSGIGAIGDSSTEVIGQISHVPTRNQVWVVKKIDQRAKLLSAESLITGDRYTFIRDAYLQHRDFLVNDGQLEDDFGDEDFDEWDDELGGEDVDGWSDELGSASADEWNQEEEE